jgi:hypothetical protein
MKRDEKDTTYLSVPMYCALRSDPLGSGPLGSGWMLNGRMLGDACDSCLNTAVSACANFWRLVVCS